MVDLDELDLGILASLQADAGRSAAEISEAVHLSPNACWRRIKRLEGEGVIRKRVALLDAAKVGVPMTVFVSVRAAEHSEKWLEKFAKGVRSMPQVVEFYRLSGEIDYLLKLLVADVAEYDKTYKQLIRIAPIIDVSASFAMEELKHETAIPLPTPD